MTLVGCRAAYEREDGRCAGLDEVVVDADVGEGAARGARSGAGEPADSHAHEWVQEEESRGGCPTVRH